MKNLLIGVAALALAGCGNNLNDPITSTEVVQTYQPPVQESAFEAWADNQTVELYPDVIDLSYADAREVLRSAGWNPMDLGKSPTVPMECDYDCVGGVEFNACDDSRDPRCTWIYQHISGKDVIVVTTITFDGLIEVSEVQHLDQMSLESKAAAGIK